MSRKFLTWTILSVGALALVLAPTPVRAAAQTEYLVFLKGDQISHGELAQMIADAGGRLLRDHSQIGLAIATADSLNFAPLLSQNAKVRRVQEDALQQGDTRGFRIVAAAAGYADQAFPGTTTSWDRTNPPGAGGVSFTRAPIARIVTDPTRAFFYPSLGWNYRAANAPPAWALGLDHLGSADVTVATVDTGIDYVHLDMTTKVDLTKSASFVPEDDALVAANFPGAHPVADLNFHGTLVAGTIACNARGTACLAPNVTLIGVKVVNRDYQSTIGRMVSGIMHAADVDADIINISFVFFPYHSMDTESGRAAWQALKAAIQYAEQQGSLVFAEAGLDPNPPFHPGLDADHNGNEKILPAEAGAVVVSATSIDDEFSNFNNFGDSLVDISAPGGHFPFVNFQVDSAWGPCSSFTLVPAIDFCRLDAPFWVSVAGTIPATAMVSATAALIKSLHPEMDANDIREQIYRTSDDLGTPGKDAFFGRGRINVFRALTE